ncbi:MAG: glycine--tRNA ligase subunit beta [Nitrospiraceae bacterium]
MKRPLVKKKPRQHKTRLSKPTAELLFEIGMEELPFEFVVPALTALRESATRLLQDVRLSFGSIKTYGTPRRLVLVVDELLAHQTAVVKETMGPSKVVAFDQAGQPTKAAMGFAAGQGVTVGSLEIRSTPKGEYLFAVKRDAGRKTTTLLLELLPRLFDTLSFPKAMKWNETGLRFARPVRWIVALFGGTVVPVRIAGIHAGNRTSGHRVMGGGKPITVRDFKTYSKGLQKAGVMLDPERRRAAIQQQIDRLCVKAGVGLNADDVLLDQAVYTTEWPCAVLGSFKPEYLAVPSEILITSMKEHQGFFSVRDKKSGKLAPHFIAIANNEPKNMALIRSGNERVLAARLADAKFFFDQDRETRPEDCVEKLRGVTFHQKLGTVYDKMERTEKLVSFLAIDTGNQGVVEISRRAARLANADLVSAVVGEFPTLQGVMGGEYAKHAGENSSVSKAITEQYLPRGMEGPIPDSLVGKLLSLADRFAKITGFFRVGVVPKGSEDPYALRRDALAIVRILVEGDIPLILSHALDKVEQIYDGANFPEQQHGMTQGALDFIVERFRYYAGTGGGIRRDDVINAVLSKENIHSRSFRQLLDLMKALEAVTRKPEFDPLIVGFKRAHRLVEKEQWERQPVDVAKFQHPSESALHQAVTEEGAKMGFALSMGDYHEALNALVGLRPVIDAFFEAVMVNADDKAIRGNRLTVLKEVDELFMSFADFSQVVVEGR